MSISELFGFGIVLAGIIAALLGYKRGDVLRVSQASNPAPFALVGPTLADSQIMERWIAANLKQTEAMEKLVVVLGRLADHTEEKKTDKIADALQRLTEKLDEQERRPRR